MVYLSSWFGCSFRSDFSAHSLFSSMCSSMFFSSISKWSVSSSCCCYTSRYLRRSRMPTPALLLSPVQQSLLLCLGVHAQMKAYGSLVLRQSSKCCIFRKSSLSTPSELTLLFMTFSPILQWSWVHPHLEVPLKLTVACRYGSGNKAFRSLCDIRGLTPSVAMHCCLRGGGILHCSLTD